MSYTAQEYLDSIEASLRDLRAAADQIPVSVLRDLDRQVDAIRKLWIEYRAPTNPSRPQKSIPPPWLKEKEERRKGIVTQKALE